MAGKIKCPFCDAMTYNTRSCGSCGKELPRNEPSSKKPDEEVKAVDQAYFRAGILEPASQCEKKYAEVQLAQYKAIAADTDEELATTELVVKKDRQQRVYWSMRQAPVKLSEGRYSLGKILIGDQGQLRREAGCLVCEVSETPLPITIALPDKGFIGDAAYKEIEKDDKDIDAAWLLRTLEESIKKLNMRTADDFIGTALLQMRLLCRDPLQLVRCFREEKRPLRQTEEETDDSFWPWLKSKFTRSDPVKATYAANSITLAQLYPRIRMELAEAVCNSIRNFTVAALYDREDSNRSRLHVSIRDYMQTTLQAYGLHIVDIAAFQFRSTDYENFLQKRAGVSLERQTLDDIERKAADVRRGRRELEHDEFEHVEETDEKKELITHDRELRTLDRDGATDERKDRLAHDKQTRQLTMEEERLEFNRRQEAEEFAQQHAQRLRALEVNERVLEHNAKVSQQWLEAEHNRRLEAIKLIAGFPAEQQFLLAMQYNPGLQEAFVALQQAKSNDDKRAMAEGFQVQVQKIYGEQSRQTSDLLQEAARALGLAVGAKIKDSAPPKQQHLIVHQAPTQPPPENPS